MVLPASRDGVHLIKKVVTFYHAMKMVSSQSNTHLETLEVVDRLGSEEGDLQILDLELRYLLRSNTV